MPYADPEEARTYRHAWRKNNPDKMRLYRERSKDKLLEYYRKYRDRNRDKIRVSQRKWATNNSQYYSDRMKDPTVRLQTTLRARILGALSSKTNRGHKKATEFLGCSIEDFKIYIESRFQPGMNWENRGIGGWHIDHIMPLAIFGLSKPEHQKRAFHFSNLQPLWQSENLKKSSKVKSNQFNLL